MYFGLKLRESAVLVANGMITTFAAIRKLNFIAGINRLFQAGKIGFSCRH